MEEFLYVISAIAIGGDEWVVKGIYSKESDALAKLENLKQDNLIVKGSEIINEMYFSSLVDLLVKEKLAFIISAIFKGVKDFLKNEPIFERHL